MPMTKPMRSITTWSWLAGFIGLMCMAMAQAGMPSSDLATVIAKLDVAALRTITAESAPGSGRQILARAVLQELAGEDATAIRSLHEAMASGQLDDELRFAAYSELGDLHMRNQQYPAAVSAFTAALALSDRTSGMESRGIDRALANARAFASVPAMSVAVLDHAAMPLVRDAMDLPRADALIDGHPVQAILDTGAANSVVSVTTAKRLHLRLLPIAGGAVGIAQLAARFSVADTLRFAGHEFRHVPLIVLPDAALEVPLENGVIRLEPIIGLSVLRRLGRFEILRDGAAELLRVRAGVPAGDSQPNLLLPGTLPMVMVRANANAGGGGTPLRMALDTGANRSALAPAALSTHPDLVTDATRGKITMAGAGGMVANDTATILPQLSLQLGSTTSQLMKVPVAPGPEHCDGTLGQDVLRSGGGYVIDFEHMRVDILPAANDGAVR